MSGVAIVRALLVANAPVIAVVPAVRIIAGVLPINMTLPAITVSQVSSLPHNTVAMIETPKLHTDRVQVSVHVKAAEASGSGYPGMRALLQLILAACPNTHATVAGFAVDSVIPDLEGPDLFDDVDGMHQGSRDFLVRYRQ